MSAFAVGSALGGHCFREPFRPQKSSPMAAGLSDLLSEPDAFSLIGEPVPPVLDPLAPELDAGVAFVPGAALMLSAGAAAFLGFLFVFRIILPMSELTFTLIGTLAILPELKA